MARLTLTLEEIAAATGGRILAPSAGVLSELCLDSRKATAGCIFAALKGEYSDGHYYVSNAVELGASALLLEREVSVPDGCGALLVESVEDAVRALGRLARNAFGGTVVAIVGSCGKTTTKDFTVGVLERLGAVSATPGNRNNLLGLPETLMASDIQALFWVVELGISRPLEMEKLAPVVRPSAVVFTNIRPVHMEFFSSLDAILEEKTRVLDFCGAHAPVFLNGDDPLLRKFKVPGERQTITFGRREDCMTRIMEKEDYGPMGTSFILAAGGRNVEGMLSLPGRFNLDNFAAAAAVGLHYGLTLEEIADSASGLRLSPHRGEIYSLPGDVLLLDNSYNSNPYAAASVLRDTTCWGRRTVAALGEMLELGVSSEHFHEETGRLAVETGVAALLAVGNEGAKVLAEAFRSSGRPCFYAHTWREGVGWFLNQVRDGDCVLVKGSRGIGLDGLVELLSERLEG